ncbi:hypothetical protein BVC80_8813g9 [Macleaya cordata]|uniref:Uncharacterized protein n=1 Tax=Macleaya cordata TaxID=56857 RepID=A0A200R062_MACCD|nr:hypothetical protein BVC80_8813g9 [Macleaya cordata]
MEQKPSLSSSWPREEQDLNLREWALKGRIISRENTKSRRFSASNIKSFREEARSFRSNATISSTASSPGYTLKEEIDPSTYSFTSALRALQVRSGYVWDCLSPDGFALNSKWNDAEKYICNPVSGEVPMECLSTKTLSGRSIPTKKTRITVSGPLFYSSSHSYLVQSKPILTQDQHQQQEEIFKSPIKEEIQVDNNLSTTRDVGTQSTPTDLSSSSSPISPSSTPSIKERSLKKHCEVLLQSEESPNSGSNKSRSTNQEEDLHAVHSRG